MKFYIYNEKDEQVFTLHGSDMNDAKIHAKALGFDCSHKGKYSLQAGMNKENFIQSLRDRNIGFGWYNGQFVTTE